MPVMTAKERLRQVVSQMSEEEAADALALVAGARAGATPTDIFGTAWGKVLADVDPQALSGSGASTISVPGGIPDVKPEGAADWRGALRDRGEIHGDLVAPAVDPGQAAVEKALGAAGSGASGQRDLA